jgi:hypothetical protein
MKWFLVAILATRMEAWELGSGELAQQQCRHIIQAFERRETVVLPKRLVDMIELDVVATLSCVDGDTVMEIAAGRFGPRGRLETGEAGALNRPLPRIPYPTPLPPETVFRTPRIGEEPIDKGTAPLIRKQF